MKQTLTCIVVGAIYYMVLPLVVVLAIVFGVVEHTKRKQGV